MLTVLGYAMILIFMGLILTKKMSPVAALVLVPVVFGGIAAYVTGASIDDLLRWIYEGLYFKKGASKVSSGVAPTVTMLLFAILYFSVMLDCGLFDPVTKFLIRWAKGDPQRLCVAVCLISLVVSLDGDGTTTAINVTTAVLSTFKKMRINLVYLAVLIGIPNAIMNLVPWSGPIIRAMPALSLGAKDLFLPVIPGMLVTMVMAVFMAMYYGKKERIRLNYNPTTGGVITEAEMAEIMAELDRDEEGLKRPKLIWFNFLLTIVVLTLLIMDLVNGGILFILGSILAVAVNYRSPGLQADRLIASSVDAMGPVSLVFASGFLMGILNGSGMSNAIAAHICALIPQDMGQYIPFFIALVSLPGLFFLPNDAWYFGIIPVVAPVAYSFGASATEVGTASLIGQACRFASPLVAWLYVLVGRCGINFGDHQKEYLKWGFLMYILWLVTAVLTGALKTPFF